jgi:hypothetical protein
MFPDNEDNYSEILTDKSRNPNFNFKRTHEIEIDEEFCGYLLSNTLTVGIWGKKESKSSKVAKDNDGQ